MSDNNDEEVKKGFPGGFLLLLLAGLALMFMLQTFMTVKVGSVSFSYQLEHLVNQDLLQPEQSRKTAVNDNLATFSGKFREQLTDTATQRHKYLTLLNTRLQLNAKKERTVSLLDEQQAQIRDAADWYLHLTAMSIPEGGFVVVDSLYDIPERQNRVVLHELSDRAVSSLPAVDRDYRRLQESGSTEDWVGFGRSLAALIRDFRSPVLGIGDQVMKQKLKQMDRDVIEASMVDEPGAEQVGVYSAALRDLKGMAATLAQVDDYVLLRQLRAVRNYTEAMTDYELVLGDLENNEAQLLKARDAVENVVWYFNNQELSTRALEQAEPEVFFQWYTNADKEWENFDSNKGAYFSAPDQPLNLVLQKKFKSEPPPPNYVSYFITFLPVLLILVVLYFVFARQMRGVGGGAMNFGKSPARLFHQGDTQVTFKDVAGIDEAIEELDEIVDFLKNPEKYTALGGRIPKGVLAVGPPGTGKTLVARAVAGEAGRPFFSISGSDFVEMFVGVGASRIRDMFEQAKKKAPCIIFIDEIDAVGRHRGSGIGGGHDEREQTLNQLLVEMDGFDARSGIIIMAATNRPDVLDKALLRPGRFDRRVVIDLPDIKGRYDILKVHARKVKLDDSADLMSVARGTPGASGADLENILNEAALMAARKGRSAITQEELADARDKVVYGKERRSLQMDEKEKRTTAYHESGHAVVGLLVPGSDPVDKVTIIPRGQSLGATHFLPDKNRLSYWKKELHDKLAVLMGGRCAEELFCGDYSSGAQQDFHQATQIARSMVCQWGMSDKVGVVAYDERSEAGQYLGMSQQQSKPYSEETAQVIDGEVKRILSKAYERARQLLEEHREQVELMTQMLIEFETLDRDDCVEIVVEKTFDAEVKRKRLKTQAEAHKRPGEEKVAPPPIPGDEADGDWSSEQGKDRLDFQGT